MTIAKIKRTAKRVGDTAAEFEQKAEPIVDKALNKVIGSGYTVRIILGAIVVAVVVWALV